MGYKADLFGRVIEYLESQDWHYTIIESDELYAVKLGMNLNGKLKSMDMFVEAKDNGIYTVGICPIRADDDCKATVAEYITRANYCLTNGNFEMDYSDGEVRYKTFLCTGESIPDLRAVEQCVDIPILMMNRYGNGLAKCLMGFGNPEEDIRAIEEDE